MTEPNKEFSIAEEIHKDHRLYIKFAIEDLLRTRDEAVDLLNDVVISLLENNTVPAAIQKKTVDNQYSATKNSQRAITSTPNPDQDIYEIAELGVSVRSYYGQLSATINQNFTGSHQVSNKGGVVVVAVSSGGKASRLDIKQGDRIVSYTKKGLGFGSVVINNSQELKTIAQKNGSKHFRNFYIIRNGSRFVECAKLGMFSC